MVVAGAGRVHRDVVEAMRDVVETIDAIVEEAVAEPTDVVEAFKEAEARRVAGAGVAVRGVCVPAAADVLTAADGGIKRGLGGAKVVAPPACTREEKDAQGEGPE